MYFKEFRSDSYQFDSLVCKKNETYFVGVKMEIGVYKKTKLDSNTI